MFYPQLGWGTCPFSSWDCCSWAWSRGPRLSLPLRTVVGSRSCQGPWDMAASWFSRARSSRFGSLVYAASVSPLLNHIELCDLGLHCPQAPLMRIPNKEGSGGLITSQGIFGLRMVPSPESGRHSCSCFTRLQACCLCISHLGQEWDRRNSIQKRKKKASQGEKRQKRRRAEDRESAGLLGQL